MNWSTLAKKDANGIYTLASNGELGTSYNSRHLQSDVDYEAIQDLIADITDKSSHSKQYHCLEKGNLILNHLFYPESANNLRAFSSYFDYSALENLLLVGSFSTTSSRYLAENVKSLSVIDFNYDRLRLSADRCDDLSNVDFVHVDLTDIHEWKTFDLVVTEGGSDFANYWLGMSKPNSNLNRSPYELHQKFTETLLSLVNDEGALLLTADNAVGEKYLLDLTDERSSKVHKSIIGFNKNDLTHALTTVQWRQIFTSLSVHYKEFYSFPDFRFTEVLLGKSYVDTNEDAWQHLDRVYANEYFSYKGREDAEHILLAALSKQKSLGVFANSLAFVIDKSCANKRVIDFAHMPRFERQAKYLHVVQKFSNDIDVQRLSVINGNVVSSEPFAQGMMLSLTWVNTLLQIQGIVGLDKFEDQLRLYYQFLLRLNEGLDDGLNVDCVPNNIIVDGDGSYHVIDKEWQGKFDCTVDLVFYRGIWMFMHRYLNIIRPHLYKINVRTVREFIYYAFYQAGTHLSEMSLDNLYRKDNQFLSLASGLESNYDLDFDLTVKEIDNIVKTTMSVKYRYYENSSNAITEDNRHDGGLMDGQVEVDVYSQPNLQTVTFLLPNSSSIYKMKELVFWPYLYDEKQVCFDIRSIKIVAETIQESSQKENIDNISLTHSLGEQRVIWACATQDQVIDNNLNLPLSTINQDGKKIVFLNHIFDSLKFDLNDLLIDDNCQLSVKCTFIYDFHPVYKMAKDDYFSVKKELVNSYEASLGMNKVRFEEMLESHRNIESELHEIKQSRVWKLVRAYHDVFKVENYPKKNIIGKCVTFFKLALKVIKP